MCGYNAIKESLSFLYKFASIFERPQIHYKFKKGRACHFQSTYSHANVLQLVRKTFLTALCKSPNPSTLYLARCGVFSLRAFIPSWHIMAHLFSYLVPVFCSLECKLHEDRDFFSDVFTDMFPASRRGPGTCTWQTLSTYFLNGWRSRRQFCSALNWFSTSATDSSSMTGKFGVIFSSNLLSYRPEGSCRWSPSYSPNCFLQLL